MQGEAERRRPEETFAISREELANQMNNSRSNMVIGVSSFSPEDRRRQLEDSIVYWQAAGPRAIWDATCEITAEWFLLRGIDPTTQRVDKTVCGVLPVPWNKNELEHRRDEESGGVTI